MDPSPTSEEAPRHFGHGKVAPPLCSSTRSCSCFSLATWGRAQLRRERYALAAVMKEILVILLHDERVEPGV